MQTKLRVGILINSLHLEAWKDEIIKDINTSNWGEVVLFINRQESTPLTKFQKLWKYRKSIIYKLLDKFDVFLSKKLTKKHVSAFSSVDYSSSSISIIKVYPKTTKFCDIILDNDLEEIKRFELDVILRFGFRILKGGILNNASKHGVWSFHNGDNRINRGGPPGFWEVIEGWKETGAILQRLSNDLDGGTVLARTWVATYKYNIRENKNRIYWRASKIVPRLLRELYELGAEDFYKSKAKLNAVHDFYTSKLYKAPDNWRGILIGFTYLKIVFTQILDVLLFKDQWFLLYRAGKNAPELSFRRMKKIYTKNSIFWADPFIVTRNNADYIFVEEYDWKTNKGHISVVEFINEKPKATKIIENTYHYSYPFIFEFESELYMIPETASNKTVELYKCQSFPYKWTLEKTIFEDIVAVDTTLFYYNKLWWMFTSIDETKKSTKHDELFIYYASNPITGEWKPHKKNPVITDAKVARPAGNIFMQNDKIFRPSQNCTGIYGSAININEILVLNKDEYQEQLIHDLKPDWDPKIRGIHTLNFSEYSTVIDGFKKAFKWM